MGKLILGSILFFSVALPARAARDANASRGARRLLLYLGMADMAYLALLAVLYQRFL